MDRLSSDELIEIAVCIEIVRSGKIAEEVSDRNFQKKLIRLYDIVLAESARRD